MFNIQTFYIEAGKYIKQTTGFKKNIGQSYRLAIKNLLSWKKGLFLFEGDYKQRNYLGISTYH